MADLGWARSEIWDMPADEIETWLDVAGHEIKYG